MIDETELEQLRSENVDRPSLEEVFDTLSAALKVVRAAEAVVRDRGYRIVANPYRAVELVLQMDSLDTALAPFRQEQERRK